MTLAVLIASVVLVSAESPKVFAQVQQKNIVFVLADDMRADDLAYMDRLVGWSQGGTTFENVYHTNPQCCPARTTMLTGKYSHNHGVEKNPVGSKLSGYQVFKRSGAGASYLPRWLDQAGYATGVFGKFLNGYEDSLPPPPGFDVAKISKSPRGDPGMTDRAEQFFRANAAERPVFAAVWLRSPHGPLDQPARYDGDFDGVQRHLTPAYDEADVSEKVGFIRNLGRINTDADRNLTNTWRTRLEMSRRIEDATLQMTQAALDLGELENTIFVIASDNGFFLGEHRLRCCKALPYDASSKNFLVMKGPGIEAQTRSELVGDNDFTPTLAELAGVSVPGGYNMDGRSLVPLLRGEIVPSWRDALLIEHPAPPINGDQKPGYKAVKTASGELYIEWENGHVEHYADEYQTHPANDPVRQAELEAKLDALRDCAAESCRTAEDAP